MTARPSESLVPEEGCESVSLTLPTSDYLHDATYVHQILRRDPRCIAPVLYAREVWLQVFAAISRNFSK